MQNVMRCWGAACLLTLLLTSVLAAAQPSAQAASPVQADLGYLEGRVVAVDEASRLAQVELPGGEVVTADMGQAFPGEAGVPDDLPEFRVGQRVELYFSPGPDGERQYVVSDWVRRPALLWLLALFLVVSVAVAGYKGLRAFVSTGASLLIVIWFIVPRILDGWSPALVSLLGVGGMLILAIYFVHGLSWSTTAALIGTFAAVLVTLLLGVGFTEWAQLTGFGSDEAMMINTGAAQVNLKGLLLAGLLIGALGALTDITIVQASVVRELAHADPSFGLSELYRRGMNVGNDHVGSLVNTLVLAYTGAALPLFLLLNLSDFAPARALNIELVAAEVVHTLVGSVGLVLAVPLTTFIAALMFRGDKLPIAEGELDHAHHHH